MHMISNRPTASFLFATLAITLPASLAAQELPPIGDETILVTGTPPDDLTGLAVGPELEGFISARTGDRMQVTGADGSITDVLIAPVTDIRSRGGFLGLSRTPLGADSLRRHPLPHLFLRCAGAVDLLCQRAEPVVQQSGGEFESAQKGLFPATGHPGGHHSIRCR